MADVVILGGGFGGLAAAHELRALLGDSHVITLVDRNDRFYMGFAKLWDLGGVRPRAASILSRGTATLVRSVCPPGTTRKNGLAAVDA